MSEANVSKRTIVVKTTTQSTPITKEVSARTLGELKKEMPEVKWDGMRILERASKNTLQMDESVLPATDFMLLLVPEKVKSGGFDIENAKYNDLRSHMSMLNKVKNANLDLSGSTDDLKERLITYYKKGNEDIADQKNPIEMIKECSKTLIEVIGLLNTTKSEPVQDNLVLKVSVEDLDKELSEIKKALNL